MCADSGDFDLALELCSRERRRVVVSRLVRERRALSLTELTEAVASHAEKRSSTTREADRERIRCSLYHEHLPKLADVGVVAFDRERKHVERAAQYDRLEPHFCRLIDLDPDLTTLATE